jgi:hypothetical protein
MLSEAKTASPVPTSRSLGSIADGMRDPMTRRRSASTARPLRRWCEHLFGGDEVVRTAL